MSSDATIWEGPVTDRLIVPGIATIITEDQVAAAGQTVFTLATFQYTPNGGAMFVYMNSGLQRSGIDYQETSATTITFLTPLNVGDTVIFQGFGVNATNLFNPNFIQAGVGAVSRTMQDKVREVAVSIKDFAGAVGDGVSDDTAAINYANTQSKYLIFPLGIWTHSGALTPQSGAIWISESGAILRRTATSANNTLLLVTNPFSARGLVFDGNKTNNANACNTVVVTSLKSKFENCDFTGAKAVAGGYGSGLMYDQAASPPTDFTARHVLLNNTAYNNDVDGFAGQNVVGVQAIGNFGYSNGNDGFNFQNFDLTFQKKLYDCVFSENKAYANTRSGMVIGNFTQNNSNSAPTYGVTNLESNRIVINSNVSIGNGLYGIVAQGAGINVVGNNVANNGASGVFYGGILFQASYGVCNSNVIESNTGFGIDCGGSQFTEFIGNTVRNNSLTGINCGGTTNCSVAENIVLNNGGAAGRQITIYKIETDGNNLAFDSSDTVNLRVVNNSIALVQANQVGIAAYDGHDSLFILNNQFYIPSNAWINNCLLLIVHAGVIEGNRIIGTTEVSYIDPVDGAGNLVIPEVTENIQTNTAAAIQHLYYYTAFTVVGTGGIGWVTMTANGAGYTSAPAVTFTGGGGAGATGTAFIDSTGKVVGVRMITYGTGYTAAPAIGFVGGGGGGATATSQLSVPLINLRKIELYPFTGQTVNRAGPPVVESAASVDIVLAARQALRLKAFSGQWNAMGKGF